MERKARTLVRVGAYLGRLEEAVKYSSQELRGFRLGSERVIKFARFERSNEPYFLVVSQSDNKNIDVRGYNILLSVASYSDEKNREVADRFESDTEISLRVDVPEELSRLFELMSGQFVSLERSESGN